MNDRILFTGREIINHGHAPDYDTAAEASKRREANIRRLLEEERQERMKGRRRVALREWRSSVPEVYKDAGPQAMSYDPEIHAKMVKSLKDWADGVRFNVVVSTPDKHTGKSWAAYSWLTGLVENGSILYPSREIVFRTEGELLMQDYGRFTRLEATFDENPDMKILVIDEMFRSSLNRNVPYREEAWRKIIDRCRRSMNKIYLVLVINPPFTKQGIMARPETIDVPQPSSQSSRPRNGSGRKTVGDMLRETSGGSSKTPLSPDRRANELIDEILPLKSYLRSYPGDSRMTRGFILTTDNPAVEEEASY